MTAIKLWDAKFLAERERYACEEAVEALTDADWDVAITQFDRAICNIVRGYRDCRDRACRRARRCIGCEPNCSNLPRPKDAWTLATEREQIEKIYKRMQIARRDAVLRGEMT